MLAEAANPEWVSVPLVGWSFFNAIRDVADVHLVTQIRNRDAILRAGLQEGRDFTAIDTERLERPLWKAGQALRLGWTSKMAINALSYPYFERLVWARFGKAIASGAFDIVHRVTPLSPTVNSSIAARCERVGVPFVLGPLNGGLPWPREFDSVRRNEKEWLTYVRGAYKLSFGRRRMFEATSVVLAGSHHTASEIPDACRDRTIYLPENGIDFDRFRPTGRKDAPTPPLRACFVGRLVPYKGPDMLIEAAAPHVRSGRLHVDIIGDGPMMDDLRTQIASLGLGGGVTLHGWLGHREVPPILGRADVLTFPSIREFGGAVVLEAMALGVTPIVVDYGGPGELVSGGYGIAIPLGPRSSIIAELERKLTEFIADPVGMCLPPEVLRRHVQEEFSWPAKARKIAVVYEKLLRGKVRGTEATGDLETGPGSRP
jgi:glycosyltransferase involved in cell wall biosynthesis